MGRNNFRGRLTDVTVVMVVIKSSMKLESKEEADIRKEQGKIWRSASELIDAVYV